MSYTKRQFIQAAFSEIGMADYYFDLTADQLDSALRRLDAMMAEWNGRGLRFGYPLPSSPQDSVISDTTYVPDYANEAVILNLAVRLAPGYGKSISTQTLALAKSAYRDMSRLSAFPNEMQLPGSMPLGAGRKSVPFSEEPEDPTLDRVEDSLGFD
jgi:hypothetical protein